MNWTKCSEQMPPEKGRYLVVAVIFGVPYIEVRRYADDLYKVDEFDFHEDAGAGWYDYDDEIGYYQVTNVTHWAPLPELPKS